MKSWLKIVLAATVFAMPHAASAQDKERFPELGLEQLTPAQKQWVDAK